MGHDQGQWLVKLLGTNKYMGLDSEGMQAESLEEWIKHYCDKIMATIRGISNYYSSRSEGYFYLFVIS